MAKKSANTQEAPQLHAHRPKKERRVTDRVLIGKATIWAMKNKARLDDMPFEDIQRMFQKQFDGQFISPEAIKDICKSAEIRRLKGARSKVNQQAKMRTMARVMLEFVTKVEEHMGAKCLSDEGRHVLEKLKAGAKHEWDQQAKSDQSEGD